MCADHLCPGCVTGPVLPRTVRFTELVLCGLDTWEIMRGIALVLVLLRIRKKRNIFHSRKTDLQEGMFLHSGYLFCGLWTEDRFSDHEKLVSEREICLTVNMASGSIIAQDGKTTSVALKTPSRCHPYQHGTCEPLCQQATGCGIGSAALTG